MSQPDYAAPQNRAGKNILVFCDGTGNKFIDDPDAPGSNSNVVKLYTTLKIDGRQVAYYHPGVGTAGDPTAKHWLSEKWSVLKGLAFASGFKDNVFDAYRYLMETFEEGDRVYLFGFSRGAYTVRALGGLLDGYGLLYRGNEGHLQYAWNEYVRQHNDRKRHHVQPNQRFKETFSRPGFCIHFMGIWDTVSSVGWISSPLRLFSVAHNSIIQTGRHAISIDERRCFYRNNLWIGADQSQVTKTPAADYVSPRQDLLQIWFAGVHSDIGGSYQQKESVLSNVALNWLIGEAQKAGVEITPEMRSLVLGEKVPPTGNPEIDRKIAALQALYIKPTESIVHQSLGGLWWLLEFLPHRYYDMDDARENWRTPLGMPRRIPSGSYIHCSANERIESRDDYNPKNIYGGPASLQRFDVPTQDPGLVYLYAPANDPQPLLNKPAVRISVMILVTALDLVVVALVPAAAWWLWHTWHH